jgi:CheY-like chemotaxis protein
VVDDNEAVRSTAIRRLKRLGYRLIEADGPAAALRILDRIEEIDLLFTDIVMQAA